MNKTNIKKYLASAVIIVYGMIGFYTGILATNDISWLGLSLIAWNITLMYIILFVTDKDIRKGDL